MGFNHLSNWWHGRHRGLWWVQNLDSGSHLSRVVIFLLVLMLAGVSTVNAKYAGGTGDSNTPFLIFTPENLALIGNSPEDWNKHFKLLADVDMSDYNGLGGRPSFAIIGYLQWDPYLSLPFRGTFDGNHKRIMNLRIARPAKDFTALFGYVYGSSALIKDLTLVNPQVDARYSMYVGAVVGKLRGGSIAGCTVEGGSVFGGDCTGGLVGYNMLGSITNCYIKTYVNGITDVGGIAGYNDASEISRCGFTGQVRGRNDVGGLAGESDGDIVFCYADGNVSAIQDKVAGLVGTLRGVVDASFAKGRVDGLNEVGGLVGRNMGQIKNSYSRGSVSGNQSVGGFAGLLYDDGTISCCYSVFNLTVSGNPAAAFVGSADGGAVSASFWAEEGIQNETMLTQNTYTQAGWDFAGESANGRRDIWCICEGTDYPRLVWEKVLEGDFLCPEGVDLYDIEILFEQWLKREASADITGGQGGDGAVNFEDFVVIGAAWKTSVGQKGWNARCDIWPIGGDGKVDEGDLSVFAEGWLGDATSQADVSGTGPDGIVNFLDLAMFARAWQSTKGSANWNARCDVAPEGGDGVINADDLIVFIDRWLSNGAGLGDFAPLAKPDGIVNFLDFALAAKNYLSGD